LALDPKHGLSLSGLANCEKDKVSAKEPYVSAKGPCISAKEPYVSAKEACNWGT